MPNSEPTWIDGRDSSTLHYPPCSIHVYWDENLRAFQAVTDPALVFLTPAGEPTNLPVLLVAETMNQAKLEAITVLRQAVRACVDAAGKIYRNLDGQTPL